MHDRLTPWRNGSASDSRSEGCVFESRRGQINIFVWLESKSFLMFLIYAETGRKKVYCCKEEFYSKISI